LGSSGMRKWLASGVAVDVETDRMSLGQLARKLDVVDHAFEL